MIKQLVTVTCIGCALGLGNVSNAENLDHTIVHAGDTPSRVGGHNTFTGAVRHDSIAKADENSHYTVSVVTFEPGARTFWHSHPAGQRMLVVSGKGLVGTPDGKVRVIRQGDNVWCPPNLKHWHGATPETAMAHLVLTNVKDGKNVTWMEEVSDADYKQTPENN